MKRAMLIILITVNCFFAISFTKPAGNTSIQSDWGEWKAIPAYNGILFRVKKGDYNQYSQKYYWYFQFKNQYTKEVTFNYGYTPIDQSYTCNPNHYKDLQAGEVSDVTGDLLAENNRVYVCVGDVKWLQ